MLTVFQEEGDQEESSSIGHVLILYQVFIQFCLIFSFLGIYEVEWADDGLYFIRELSLILIYFSVNILVLFNLLNLFHSLWEFSSK